MIRKILEDTSHVLKHVKRGSDSLHESLCQQICNSYSELSASEKMEYFAALVYDFGLAGSTKITIDIEKNKPIESIRKLHYVQHLTVPQYNTLFKGIGRIQGGVKQLVVMRSDLLELQKSAMLKTEDVNVLRLLDHDLKDQLSQWFCSGLFTLQRVTWESPCVIMQKISEYEAVHPVNGWQDLRRRVGAYRRCYVFTHGCIPGEPLVICHTALLDHLADDMGDLLPALMGPEHSTEDPNKIRSAMFYSITSPHQGLRGIDLGHNLIKRVVKELKREFPTLNIFSSISPIPKFNKWLFGEINQQLHHEVFSRIIGDEEASTDLLPLVTPDQTLVLMKAFNVDSTKDLYTKLRLELESQSWVDSTELMNNLKVPLMQLCARYLYAQKHRGFALDPVANFHLRNGAVMYRLNWLADTSARGLGLSCGMMLNFRYYPNLTRRFSERYLVQKAIAVGPEFGEIINIKSEELPPDDV